MTDTAIDKRPSALPALRVSAACLLLIVLGLAAYWNSLAGVFLLDDQIYIVENDDIRSLTPFSKFVLGGGLRKLVVLSLAVNYRIGGLEPVGYHIFNMAIHCCAGLALFLLLKQTFASTKFSENIRSRAGAIALAGACIWIVHPLNTQAVTYIVQRGESMMGLALFVFLMCYARSYLSSKATGWMIAAWITFCVGLICKEVMLVALPIALLYDRAFLSDTWSEARRQRGWLWLACALPLVIGAITILPTLLGSQSAVGLQLESVRPWEYLRTQPEVLLHYLRLTFVPWPQVFDYGWPVEHRMWVIASTGIVIGLIAVASLVAFVRAPHWGFWPLAALLLLAPTSSFLPLQDLAVEHRMYAPLAFVVAFSVLIGFALSGRLFQDNPAPLRWLACTVAVVGLSALTINRNADYTSAIRMWKDVIAKTSASEGGNALAGRAYANLGSAYGDAGQWAESLESLKQAQKFSQFPPHVHANMARAYLAINSPQQAQPHIEQAMKLNPTSARMRQLAGLAHNMLGQPAEAERYYREALELNPRDAIVMVNLGLCLIELNKLDQAEQKFREAIERDSEFAEPRKRLIDLLTRTNQLEPALKDALSFVQEYPEDPQAHLQLGSVYAALQRTDEAIEQWKIAAQSPSPPHEVNLMIGNALRAAGKLQESIAYFEAELRVSPNNADALNRLAESIANDNPNLAIRYFQRVVDLAPKYLQARYNIAALQVMIGEKSKAISQIDALLAINPNFEPALRLRADLAK